jgi:hypothetical protein
MEASEAELGRLCTSVQVLVNLMEAVNRYISGGLFGGCALRRQSAEDEQRQNELVHRMTLKDE